MAASAAGEEKAPEEQAPWFGQPAQAAALPASWEVGPTHPSLALDGAADDMVGILMGSESGGVEFDFSFGRFTLLS